MTNTAADLLQSALSHSTADQAEASYHETVEASTRFANNAITQNVAKREATLTLRSAFGQRVGRATTNDLSPAGLKECVQRAEALARASEPDTEFLNLPGAQEYLPVIAFDPATDEATPEDRAAGVRQALEVVTAAGLQSAGSYSTDTDHVATANTAGLFYEGRFTAAGFTLTAIGSDSSGWAESSGTALSEVDPAATADRAARKALLGRAPAEAAPGDYTVVLEPAATADFLAYLLWSLDAKAAHEGRSAFSAEERHEGKRIAPLGTTLSSHPGDLRCPVCPAGEDGLPIPSVTWIDDGVLRTLSYDRFWAQKSGHAFTGRPTNLVVTGDSHSLGELIAPVERGLLITRFWYIRFVDPMKLLLTGMTRDGLFAITNGRVTGGVKNMRFNESPLDALARITARGETVRADRYGRIAAPALRIDGFRFTSGTSF